jgi:hypothetical protein
MGRGMGRQNGTATGMGTEIGTERAMRSWNGKVTERQIFRKKKEEEGEKRGTGTGRTRLAAFIDGDSDQMPYTRRLAGNGGKQAQAYTRRRTPGMYITRVTGGDMVTGVFLA